MQMQEYKRALYDFSAAIRAAQKKDQDPHDIAEYYLYAGQCNQFLGQYQEAVQHYEYGISKNENNGELFFHLGLAYVSLQEYEKGNEMFKKASEKTTGMSEATKFKIHLNQGIN